MDNKRLELLIPFYNETEADIKPLLDSVAIQQAVDLNQIGVIIVVDGEEQVGLSPEFLNAYEFDIGYFVKPHSGVSATRNYALDKSTADYVMFCDCDDMFCSVLGLWFILDTISKGGFDTLVSVFTEEGKNPMTGERFFHNRENDKTFVHGKVHRRKYLLDNNIRWNDSLTIHEDSYFNILCQTLTSNAKYCPVPFYLWKWRDSSVCRRDPKYILKTYVNMIESNTALVKELIGRGKKDDARVYVTSLIYEMYFLMNKKEWLAEDNKEYRDKTERRFLRYYREFAYLVDQLPEDALRQVISAVRTRIANEGLVMEEITFKAWIEHILSLEEV